MRFIWDKAKNVANLRKHGIDFEDAKRVFDGPVLEQVDARRDYGEQRIAALGRVGAIEMYVVYTWRGIHGRGEARRIISARRANRYERKIYRRAIEEAPRRPRE